MAKTISTKEIKMMMDKDEKFVLVNVLDNTAYEEEHICGSINIPVATLEIEAAELLEKNERIIAYCAGPQCLASQDAADKLVSLGHRDVARYRGGMEEWTKAGYCTEGAAIERRKRAAS
jgi:rhodanese-related sulfurtransferase